MTQQISIFVFDDFAQAQRAREALLEAGWDESQVGFDAGEDEAGPVQGNFVSGNIDTDTGPIERAFNAAIGADNHTYAGNYDKTGLRGLYRLRVGVDDAEQGRRGAAIASGFGGTDVEARTPNG
jgi:hypothetical protein